MEVTLKLAVAVASLLAFAVAYDRDAPGIRLTGGSGPHEGNVQILFNFTTWKYVCDDGWGSRDAKVTCRQLGFAKAVRSWRKSYFPTRDTGGNGDYNSTYWSSNLQCTGDEQTLRTCNNGAANVKKCRGRRNAAGVVCTNKTETLKLTPTPSKASGKLTGEFKIRLEGESTHGFISTGFLEVFYDGVWGAVCSDNWTPVESFVACGNLGYPNIGMNLAPNGHAHYLVSHYVMKNVKCAGKESAIHECDHAGWRRHVCHSGKAVYLDCKRSPLLRDNRFDVALIENHSVRLRSGASHSEGRVEIKHDKKWGSICDDGWDINSANIFCRQMGFGTAKQATHEASFGQGSGKVWLDDIKCEGFETSIDNCKHARWGKSDCGHKEDAGVKCHYPYGKPVATLKLHGHYNPLKGHVRIMHNGIWKGICGIGWGMREAQVVCRQLGLGYPKKALSTTKYGMVRSMAMYDVKCSGDELSITHCEYVKPDRGRCRYYDIASVDCTPNAPDLVMDVAELKNSITIESKTLQSLSCAYEENCLGSDAKYQMWWPDMFNRTLMRFSARFWNRGTDDFRPNVRKTNWKWHHCHQHFHSMERFADYDLTDFNDVKRAEGHKASFCLEDYECEKGVKKLYNCARKGDQGVQVNCADTYKQHLDCQWVDVTQLKYGSYKLRVVLNPQNLVYETDYSNNIASCELEYVNRKTINVKSCKLEHCERMSVGGQGDGACCKFPFIYQGKQFHTCTSTGRKALWCATTGNYDKDGLWGYCK